jgi:hypothetical protein
MESAGDLAAARTGEDLPDEARSQVRKGNGARVMASLRNLAISILRLAGARFIAKAVRWCARDHERALRLVGLT